MPAFRLSMIFKYISGSISGASENRPAGWTESVYSTSLTDLTKSLFNDLARARARLLPTGSAIIGLRYQSIDPKGAAQTVRVNYPGPIGSDYDCDIPQMGLLFTGQGDGVANVRRFRIAAIPDDNIKLGEYKPQGPYTVDFLVYIGQLSGWKLRGRDLTVPPAQVATIDATGAVVMNSDLTVAFGDRVILSGVKDALQQTVKGSFRVGAVTDLRHLTLLNWTAGACAKGTATKFVPIYPAVRFPSPLAVTVTVRKVGRPFVKYVGRRSKKKK